MRIITTTGYYGTGSSAITDFLSEFNCIKSFTQYEFRFVFDPDGISDLEYNLIENHNRHNSGYALKRYKKNVDFLSGNYFNKKYENFLCGNWKKYSYEYIDNLTDFSYKGYWCQDVIDQGYFFYFRKRLLNKILKNTIWRNQKERDLIEMPNEITLNSRPTEEKFLTLTQDYIDKLFQSANRENMPNIMVDQLVPPSNTKRYLRYFNDLNIFIVDRDPRDIYLLSKYIYKSKVIPTDNVEIYCKWFEYTRSHRETEIFDTDKVMLVQFEDLIYKYDEMRKKIIDWLELEEKNHINIKKIFIPNNSIKNTRVWKSLKCNYDEIECITERLSKYLYKY